MPMSKTKTCFNCKQCWQCRLNEMQYHFQDMVKTGNKTIMYGFFGKTDNNATNPYIELLKAEIDYLKKKIAYLENK